MSPDQPSSQLPAATTVGTLHTSITQALKAQQRLDVEKQMISELSVFTEQLIELPGRLAHAGIARSRRQSLREAMEAFTRLSALAWDGIAGGTAPEVALREEYRQLLIAVSRMINQLQQDVAHASQDASRSGPGRWQRDHRLYQEALAIWRDGLGVSAGNSPRPDHLGIGLEMLRAAVGIAGRSSVSTAFWRLSTFPGLLLGGCVGGVAVACAASALTLNLTDLARRAGGVALFFVILWAFALWIYHTSRYAFPAIRGIVMTRLAEHDDRIAKRFLGFWSDLLAFVSAVAIGGGGVAFVRWLGQQVIWGLPGGLMSNLPDMLRFLTDKLAGPSLVLAGFALVIPILASLPFTVVYDILLAAEVRRGETRSPEARHALIHPLLHVMMVHLFLLLPLVSYGILHLPFPAMAFIAFHQFFLSGFTPTLAIFIILFYLLTVEWPYRTGSARWRRSRTAELQQAQHDLTQRLASAPDSPQYGTDITALQYALTRVQVIDRQLAEIRKMTRSPFSWQDRSIALVLVIVVAALLENGIRLGMRFFIG